MQTPLCAPVDAAPNNLPLAVRRNSSPSARDGEVGVRSTRAVSRLRRHRSVQRPRSGLFSFGFCFGSRKSKPPQRRVCGVLGDKSLTMTYFHRRTSTIIGAKAFHGPVRDGKGWDHLAMVVRRSRVERLTRCGWAHLGCASVNRSVRKKHTLGCDAWHAPAPMKGCCLHRYLRLESYRIKPHGQLVSVSSMHYCTCTPDLSTSWSRTTLQGGQAPRDT